MAGKVNISKTDSSKENFPNNKKDFELSHFFDLSLELLCVADTDGNFIHLNKQWENVFGYTIEEFKAKKFFDFIHQDDLESTFNAVKQLKDQKEVIGFTNRYLCKDGSFRWLEWRSQPSGKLIYAAARDITEKNAVDNEREATINILKRINQKNNLHDLIKEVVIFLKNLTGVTAVGVRLKEKDDYPYFETSGFPDDFIEKENFLCIKNPMDQILRDDAGNPVLECMCGNILQGRFDPSKPFFTERGSFWSNCTTELLADTTEADRQARTRNRCNAEGYESVALIPLRLGDNVFGLIQLNDKRKNRFTLELIQFIERTADSIATALSERKAVKELKDSEKRYRKLLHSVSDYIFSVKVENEKTVSTYYGEGCLNITGYTAKEFLDDPYLWYKMIHDEDKIIVTKMTEELIKGDPANPFEHRIIHKNGSVRWVRNTSVARKDETGKVIEYDGLIEDITERKIAEEEIIKLNEELEERIAERTKELALSNKELEAFSYSVSHDLKAPLRAVMGFSAMAIEKFDKEKDKDLYKYITNINTAALRMSNLIDDMLNLSRITQQEVSKSNFDLSLMAQLIIDELAAQSPKCKFVFKCAKKIVVFADLNLMKILMYNLLSNAWKYSSRKEKTLIEFGKTEKNGGRVFLIKDNGAGFDMIYAGKLLTPFQRLHSVSEFEGTGIGLAIVKRIVDKHGGKIWFESKINEGAIFYFTLG